MKILVRFLFGITISLLLIVSLPQSARALVVDGRVLFLQSFYQGYPWSQELAEGVAAVLKNRPGLHYMHDYVDTSDLGEDSYQRLLASLLSAKYRHVLPDVVIVSNAGTLDFVLKYRQEIFPEATVVYCGLNMPWDRMVYKAPNLKGLATWPDMGGTLRLIGRMHPSLDTLYVIVDNSAEAGVLEGLFRREAGNIKFKILSNWMYQELSDNLRALPQGNAALILSMRRDAAGNTLEPQQIRSIVARSRIPVYTVSGLYTGLGTVGGSMFDAHSQGAAAANLALQILAAESIDDVGPAYLDAPRVVLDADALARFGIDSYFEKGAVLLNRKPSLAEEYPALVYGVLAGAGMLLIGLAALLVLLLHRRNTMHELGVAEQRYRAMFENAVEGIFQLVPGRDFVAVNTSLARMIGFPSAEEMLSANLRVRDMLVNPEDEETLFSRLQKYTVVPGTDVSVRRSDGQELILWITLRATHDAEGKIDFIEGRAMDVTDDRRIRAELETNRERLRLALEASSDGIWDYNAITGEHYYSPRYFSMLGYAPEDFSQSRDCWADLLYPEDRDEAVLKMAQFESGVMNTDSFDDIYRMTSADGGYRWVLSRSKAVRRASSGMALRIIGINMDITELKKAQEELGELNRDLERRVEARTLELSEANTALGESLEALSRMHDNLVQSEKMAALGGLVAGVAHEINTPVGLGVTASSWLKECTDNVISRLAEGNLKRSELDKYLETARESCSTILTNLSRAADLVQSFKQVAVDQTAGDTREFNLSDLANEVLLSLRPKYKRTSHQVEMDIPTDIVMYSYPGDVIQIITNLVMNSLIHAFEDMENGVISISAQARDGTVEMHFDDNGRGVSADQAKLLFDPFYTTKRGQGGTGLGLHIVYNLVTQKLRGQISCTGELEKGLHYIISIPQDIRRGGIER